jgi:hypothetical protein
MRYRSLDRDPLGTVMLALVGAVIIGIVIWLVVACINTPSTGVVIGKRYHPAYTSTSWHCMSRDSKGNCSLNMPQSDYHPESWELCLRNMEQDKEGCRSVDQVDYHKYEIGQWYP